MDKLGPISQMMRDADLVPKKSLGQNFLFDLNITDKIARSVPDIKNSTVIEVGPGPGGLTRSLLNAGVPRLIAIEKDKGTMPILSKIVQASNNRLEVIYDDALKVFDSTRLSGIHAAICSNLPYNIGTELLIRWLKFISDSKSDFKITSMTLMFQREVANRIIAKVGDKEYGRLAVLVSLIADAKILFSVPNTAFVPQPKVQSAVIQIIPNAEKLSVLKDLKSIELLTAKLFGQRRKMIRSIMPEINWSDFGLQGTERAENLSPQTFALIASGI